jgi:hypothetical protein
MVRSNVLKEVKVKLVVSWTSPQGPVQQQHQQQQKYSNIDFVCQSGFGISSYGGIDNISGRRYTMLAILPENFLYI